ncbi:MAG: RNA-binding protein [Deltaproteobacteria bacterium]|jgi:RNA recognition motif-containing protein|nr:RNA-binding protein [Deltaproteobacteria bacterium]
MSISLFVGNFPYNTVASELAPVFARVGEVESVTLINDRQTGRPRGFGFVKMAEADGREAIKTLNGTMFEGRPLVVKEAVPIKPQTDGGGFRPRNSRPSRSYDDGPNLSGRRDWGEE